MPILSVIRSFTKEDATFFKASSLFGFKSFASILPDTSDAITISIPLVEFVLLLISTVLGLASAIITKDNVTNLKVNSTGRNFAMLEVFVLKPCRELIFRVGFSSFFL